MKKHTFILSDESENLYGFIVKTAGIDLTSFKKNPVLLFNHNSNEVIGTWEDIRIEGTQLKADAVFDEDDAQAMLYEKKVEKGIIKGCSIGYKIKRWESGYDNNPDALTECSLLEASITALPANGNTIRLYDEGGKLMIKEEVLQLLSSNKQNQISNMKKIALTLALLQVLTLSADASEEQIEARITQLANENTALKQKNTELADQVKLAKGARVKTLVDGAINDKKLTEADRAEYTALAETNFEMAEKLIGKMQGTQKVTDQLDAAGNRTGAAGKETWTIRDWEKKDSKGLLKMKAENKVEYQRLWDAEYAGVQMADESV